MSKIILVTVLVACLAMMVSASPVKETRAIKLLKQIRSTVLTDEQMDAVYSFFDEDKDGKLNHAELSNLFGFGGVDDSDSMVGILLLFGDTDHDGKLTKSGM
uniref:EF-hand domain-containing protein n=1 Tax=Octopus bimaculoides TaxID=37653 RepID=A0A0L8IEU0_OCTBM